MNAFVKSQQILAPGVTPEFIVWVNSEVARGAQRDVLLTAMRSSGWSHSMAVMALDSVLPAKAPTNALQTPRRQEGSMGGTDNTNEEATASSWVTALAQGAPARQLLPSIQDARSSVWAHDREVGIVMSIAHPRVVVVSNLLSDEECDALSELARPRLDRSRVVNMNDGGEQIDAERTSDGMFLDRGQTELIRLIEDRIAALCAWPVDCGESMQVLRYRPGAEYKAHYDYFDPSQPGGTRLLERGGQRVATLVMYLNTPAEGGATTFPGVGVTVAARKGGAVFFSYDRPDPSSLSLHAGAPVVSGEKWVATKWFRQRQFN